MKRSNTVPPWFQLSRYSKCIDLSPQEWHDQLHYRKIIIKSIESQAPIQGAEDALAEIRKSTLLTKEWRSNIENKILASYPHNAPHYERKQRLLEKYSPLYLQPVSPVKARALLLDYLLDQMGTVLDNLSEEDLDEILMGEPFDFVLKKHGMFNNHAMVEIDLNLPDTEIIQRFSEFLPEYRKRLAAQPNQKRVTDNTLKRLSKYNILAYLDLYTWEIETETRIKRSVLAIALYPDGSYGENSIRDSIHPFAITATSTPFLKMLRQQFTDTWKNL